MNHEYSCGAVVFTREAGQPRYVIIRSLEGIYGFPKGHMEPGETEAQTALREIREEVGLTPRLLPGFRVEANHLLPKKPDTMKHVIYFLAEYENQPIRPQPEELSGASLMSFEEAMAAFQYENNRAVLRQAHEALSNP
ncbi:MAG: NUDIX domain-containing protein [Clostridia bacterium]|nr:NUDIX domain-containing protein [Clostridia bacterium]